MHKITGSVLSLLFLVWFISGIVLIFEGFPHASRKERFEHLSVLSKDEFANLKVPSASWKGKVNLELCNEKPVYRVFSERKAQQVFDAETLNPVGDFSEEYAQKLASSFSGFPVKRIEVLDDFDQWVPWSYYERLLPFYKCYMDDPKHTVLYVSKKSGEIVQQTNRMNRWAARCGAIPHWIYFKNIRLQKGLWINLVLFLSAIGIIVSVSGIVVGFVRLKKGKGLTPYKKPMYKWHHITGFIFGLFVFTFILSGFFSLASVPDWMVFVSEKQNNELEWNQKLDLSKYPLVSPLEIFDALERKNGIRKICWKTIHDKPHYLVYYDDYQVPDIYYWQDGNIIPHKKYSISEIENLAKKYLGSSDFTITQQEKYDDYYSGSAMYYLPEPVYKIEVDDKSQTWLYINPASGEELKRHTKNTRLRRWLYQGLHKFNFHFLKNEAEWFRKLLLILLSIGGIAVSVTGLWLSKRWLRRTIKKTNKQFVR